MVIKGKVMKRIVFITLAMLIDTFIQELFVYIFDISNHNFYSVEHIMIKLLTLFIVTGSAIIIVKKIKKSYSGYFEEKLSYIYINLVIGFAAGIMPILLVNLYLDSLNYRLSIGIIFTSTITIIATLITSIFYLKRLMENQEYKNEIMLQEKISKMEEEHFNEVLDSYKSLKVFKHDMKAHFKIIHNLIRLKKIEELEQYIDDLSVNVQPDKLSQCTNVYIAATLNQFFSQLDSHQIEFEMEYELVKTLNMKSLHICSLFHNLVSNAIEAAIKCTDENRMIRLILTQIDRSLRVIIINPVHYYFSLEELKRGASSKEDAESHGFGLISIDKIIEHYHGNLHCEFDNGNIVSTIILLNVFD